jgi:hypothetical protein
MSKAVRRVWLALAVTGLFGLPTTVHAQLDQYDYEYLRFRGVGLDLGYLWANKVESTTMFGGRVDLGYAGPGLRIVPGLHYWSANIKSSEIGKLEDQLRRILEEANPGEPIPDITLGQIKWSDVILSLDGHFVWEIPFGALSFLGAGLSAHFLNGSGEAVNETFVEDLLDGISAGFNAHAGLEVPLSSSVRLYGTGRFELLDDLNYFLLGAGIQFMLGGEDERSSP